jgi:hypothetical protein
MGTFNERHYLRSSARDSNGVPQNFYRVDVSGSTFLSSSRYISGYFDEDAVDIYFAEFVQPKNASFPVTTATGNDAAKSEKATTGGSGDKAATKDSTETTKGSEEKPTKVEPLSPAEEGKALVLLLSSNSDEIASGISSLAQSAEVTDTLVRLVGRDRLDAAASAKESSDEDDRRWKAVQAIGKKLLADLKGADPDADKLRLLNYANRLADFVSPGKQFQSLDKIAEWVSASEGGKR